MSTDIAIQVGSMFLIGMIVNIEEKKKEDIGKRMSGKFSEMLLLKNIF